MKPLIQIQVIRGSAAFADACRAAAVTLAMVSAAQATTAEPAFAREPVAETSAAKRVRAMLPSQAGTAEKVTSEQAQTLSYGRYPPVKISVQIAGRTQVHWTLHPFDLVHLSREAAQTASKIEGIKVDPAKVGAIMMTESSLVARTGWSSNGKTPSFGLGQLELNTAKSLGVQNPNDPRECAVAVARLLAQGLKFARANNKVDERIAISLAYNTSTSLRKSLVSQYGGGLRLEHLPVATQHHVKNMAYGEQRIAQFAKLSDQHEKAMHHIRPQPKAIAMNTAHSPTPSTATLVTSLLGGNANLARLAMNQAALEREGHLNPTPMTAKGLSDMRLAISAQVNRVSVSDNPSILRSVAQDAPSAVMLAMLGPNIAQIAKSLLEKARTLLSDLVQATKITPTAQPTRLMTASSLGHSNTMAREHMSVIAANSKDRRRHAHDQSSAPRDS